MPITSYNVEYMRHRTSTLFLHLIFTFTISVVTRLYQKLVMDWLPPVLETRGTGLDQFRSGCTPTSRNKKLVTVWLHLKIGGKPDQTGLCFTNHDIALISSYSNFRNDI
jgi:hypothetical protein